LAGPSTYSSAYRYESPSSGKRVLHLDLEPRASLGIAAHMNSDGVDEVPPEAGDRITSIICDAHPVFARGLAKLLREEAPDLEINGVAFRMGDAEQLIRETLPAVALLGLAAASIPDLESIREICSTAPATRIVLLLPAIEVRAAFAVLSGVKVSGYVAKEKGLSEIAEVVRLVARGHFVMPSDIDRPEDVVQSLPSSLKEVEREILMGVAIGQTNRQIAARLHLSQRTVCRRLEDIYSKLGVGDRLEAAVYVVAHGLITSRDIAFQRQGETLQR
jgi:DNA-binding NarL/FixJ family response regulator